MFGLTEKSENDLDSILQKMHALFKIVRVIQTIFSEIFIRDLLQPAVMQY